MRTLIVLFASFLLTFNAAADTANDVWNVTVAMSVPPTGSNPLSGQTFKTFAKAEAAMRGAAADTEYLVQKDQTVGSYGANILTRYWIPPKDVAFWGPWTYSGDAIVVSVATGCTASVPSEQEVVRCSLDPRNPCGISTYVPSSEWATEESSITYQREGRNYTLTVYQPSYQSGVGYVCGPYQGPTVSQSHIQRIRYKVCPAEAPWHGASANGFGLCQNSLTADITQAGVLGGCVPEADGRTAVVGNPCDAGTGNKLEAEPDYRGIGIEFTRFYNSNNEFRPAAGFGEHWTHNYAEKIRFRDSGGTVPVVVVRADGQGEVLAQDYPSYVGERSGDVLIQSGSEWELNLKGGAKHRFGADGRLLWIENAVGQRTTLTYGDWGVVTVAGPFGHTLHLSYSGGVIVSLTDADGRVYSYSYGGTVLTGVTYPDGSTRTYHYESSSLGSALTGITDENGDRYSTFFYNSDG